ncbi:MAG: AMP-binding protein [Myxococcales bacterium]|nr:AMP-binding protein [Myxococcales bacterium]MCB9708179.1 AMP-binding protein [Myxococcales bacterium]
MNPGNRHHSLGQALTDSLIQHKANTAVIEMDREHERTRLTYQEFRHAALRLAGYMKKRGVAPDSRVAIIMSNQSKWLLAAYASLFRGAVLVPIDYKLTAPEQRALLQHSKSDFLFTEYPLWRTLRPIPFVTHVLVSDGPRNDLEDQALHWDSAAQSDEDATCVERTREDIAAIVYSSGTGGRPKGCMLSHGNYLEQFNALSMLYPLSETDRFFSLLPTNHAIDFMCGFIGPLLSGASIVHQRVLRPEFIMATLKQCGISHMAVVPLILEALERAIREKLDTGPRWGRHAIRQLVRANSALTRRRPRHAISRRLLAPIHTALGGRLRYLFCGGAKVDPKHAEFLYSLGLPVVIGYGLTEACTVLTLNDLKPFRSDSVGSPLPGMSVRIHNPDALGIGEVQVQSPTVMQGYLDDEEQTLEAFKDGWLKTGDQGYMDAARHVHLVGRSKNMIVTAGGKNVYPEDVEGAFAELPCKEFAVMASNFVWPSTKLGDDYLLAVAQPRDDAEAFLNALQRKNRSLPDYKRLRGIVLWDHPFPRTASLKLKRQLLAEQMRDQVSQEAIRSLR